MDQFNDILDKATSNFQLDEDLDSLLKICDLINEEKCPLIHVFTSIDKKLCSKNPHVVYLALLVLGSMEKNCSQVIHSEIITKSYMGKLCQLVKMTKHEKVKEKNLELIQKIDPRLSKKDVKDKRNIMFIADKNYECVKCKELINLGEEMRNCQACENVFCTFCSLMLAEFGVEKHAGVGETCYESKTFEEPDKNKKLHGIPANFFTDFLPELEINGKGEDEEEEEEEGARALPLNGDQTFQNVCHTCRSSFLKLDPNQKVHCRVCENYFCSDCASRTTEVPFTTGPVRICDTCYTLREGANSELSDADSILALVPDEIFERERRRNRIRFPPPGPAPVPAAVNRQNLFPDGNNLSEEEQLQLAITLSLDETQNFIPEQADIDLAIALSLSEALPNQVEPEKTAGEFQDEDTEMALAMSLSQSLQEKKYESLLAVAFGDMGKKSCRKCKADFKGDQKTKNCKACGNTFCENCIVITSSLAKFGKKAEICKICYDLFAITANLKIKPLKKKKSEKEKLFVPAETDKTVCHKCRVKLGNTQNKDFCQACGNLFCHECLLLESFLPVFAIDKKVRVCEPCYEFHNNEQKSINAVKRVKILEEENNRLYKENSRLKEARECKICLETDASNVFFPCKHLIACQKCATKFQQCPGCRQDIDSVVQIFMI